MKVSLQNEMTTMMQQAVATSRADIGQVRQQVAAAATERDQIRLATQDAVTKLDGVQQDIKTAVESSINQIKDDVEKYRVAGATSEAKMDESKNAMDEKIKRLEEAGNSLNIKITKIPRRCRAQLALRDRRRKPRSPGSTSFATRG